MRNYICLDGKQIEISDETAENLRKKFEEYQFQHGDVAISSCGYKRIIIKTSCGLVSYCESGSIGTDEGQEGFVHHGYKKIGNVFDD